MERFSYFFRRLLLMIPTFFGITIVCFTICQFVPGGPLDQIKAQIRGIGSGGESGASGAQGETYTKEQLKIYEREFDLDKPIIHRYWIWLVEKKMGMSAKSYKYNNKTVWELIRERFPISLTFGITSFILTYLICIPLGISKALNDGNYFDIASSVMVLILYAIPAFAFGMVLKTLFCGTSDFLNWFPVSGHRSEEWQSLSFFGRIKDQTHHMFLPVICYIIGNFALLTILMKNSLLEQISQDYVRTVLAKGGTKQRAIWKHTLRNALIPIVTGIGGILTIMFAGSVLIEKVFDINGIGLLSLDAITSNDYMVFMGITALTSIGGLLGRILSDFCYVLVDPRINFGKDA